MLIRFVGVEEKKNTRCHGGRVCRITCAIDLFTRCETEICLAYDNNLHLLVAECSPCLMYVVLCRNSNLCIMNE